MLSNMARRDDLDTLIYDLAEDDPDLPSRVAAALERRELARQLADRRRAAGLTQIEIAQRMGTSQGQVTRFESGADTRLSTVARYAAALGVKVDWTITSARPSRRSTARTAATQSRAKVRT
jgi:ribosome-binding protein aMBF1 (putative translation factor)